MNQLINSVNAHTHTLMYTLNALKEIEKFEKREKIRKKEKQICDKKRQSQKWRER